TRSPCSSAAAVRRATVSSVSPKYCRRSEWPTIAPATPSSCSIGAEISPVYAPSAAQWTFWAKTVWALSTAVASETYGGQSTASTPSGGRKAAQKSRVSPGPLDIFQFAAISTRRASYEPPSCTNRRPLSNRLLLAPGLWKPSLRGNDCHSRQGLALQK